MSNESTIQQAATYAAKPYKANQPIDFMTQVKKANRLD